MRVIKLFLLPVIISVYSTLAAHAVEAVSDDVMSPGQAVANYTTETDAGTEAFESVPEVQETSESFQGVSKGDGSDADDIGGDTSESGADDVTAETRASGADDVTGDTSW